MDSVRSIGGSAEKTATQNQNLSAKSMGKDDFLKMLIAQLKNQDPTNPQQGTEFAAQLAQYSSLEQLTNLNTAVTSQNANEVNLINTQLVSLIGKEITALTPAATDGTPGATINGRVTAVNFKDQAVSLTVDGKDVSFRDVLAVKAGE